MAGQTYNCVNKHAAFQTANYHTVKRSSMSQYIICQMQFAKMTRMSYYFQLDFAVYKSACFSINKAESTNSSLTDDSTFDSSKLR